MLRSAPPRGPRGSSPAVRGGGGRGGGIQKRRGGGGPVRVDRDGDLVMDAAAAAADKRKSGKGRIESPRPQGSGRTSGGPHRGGSMNTQKAQQAIIRGLGSKQGNVLESRIANGPTTTLQIHGLKGSKAASNPDGGLESLLGFLERKASGLDSKSNRTIRIKKSHLKGDLVIITASPEDIASIQKLDKFTFAGSVLSIKSLEHSTTDHGRPSQKTDGPSPSTVETKEQLKAVLASRYNAEQKLLNLSALSNDEGLKAMGVFDGSTTTSKIFPALMVVCDGLFKSRKEKSDAIMSVTLADNGLRDVSEVSSLAQTFQDLKNLDLSNNAIADIKALEPWKHKFRQLENLLLSGNPIVDRLPADKDELMKRYPCLQYLNGVQVRTIEDVNTALAASKAATSPIPIAGPDFRDVAQVGENFIRQFLPLYDSDRNTLLASLYDAQSLFSISVNMNAPRDRKNTAPIPSWTPYTKHSRNLTKITHLSTRMARQNRGPQAIHAVWSSLPATRHPDLQSESSKYLIECHPTSGLPDPSGQNPGGVDGLILTIHGEFEEPNPDPKKADEKALRSFSRTFSLGPGAPGASPIRVVSDMMVLRAWSPLATPPPVTAPQQQAPEQQQQEAITMQLVEKTGMTINYAILCLTETGWDLEKAYLAFTMNKDKLPADAFMPR